MVFYKELPTSKNSCLFVLLCLFLFLAPSPAQAFTKERIIKRIQKLYDTHEAKCLEKGWQKKSINVDGIERHILWNAPEGPWINGVIIALHGGGGTFSNYCSNMRIGKPMVDFGEMALAQGFAVLSLDSGRDFMRDENGVTCGKRWISLNHDKAAPHNTDVQFIETVIDHLIPEMRPEGSKESIYMTGISNGGFMTILAASKIKHKINGFAPVSAGDPDGIRLNCAESTFRANAPGRWYDKKTGLEMGKDNSCHIPVPSSEIKPFQMSENKVPFIQFHHKGDSAVDYSCMEQARLNLIEKGFEDKGAYVVDEGRKALKKHFWLDRYNQPILDFFKSVE